MNVIAEILSALGLLADVTPPSIPAVSLFPASPYPNPFVTAGTVDPSLKAAAKKLDDAIKAAVAACPAVRFTIADVTGAFATPQGPGPFPVGNVNENNCDFIASVAKVPVMYAAYELRAMVRRVIKAVSPASAADLLASLATLNPQILNSCPRVQSASNITDRHRLPNYAAMFAIKKNSSGTLEADFTPAYALAMNKMIVVSDDGGAATCIHGIGYSYLNGALPAAGFFSDPIGVWVAGDFLAGTSYPSVRLPTTPNDDPAGQTGTTIQLARIFTLIKMRALVSSASSNDDDTASGAMEALLHSSAVGPDVPWASRPAPPLIPRTKFLYNKLGVGSITLGSTGPSVFSETSLIEAPVHPGRRYVVSWQHLTRWADIRAVSQAIFSAIQTYEGP